MIAPFTCKYRKYRTKNFCYILFETCTVNVWIDECGRTLNFHKRKVYVLGSIIYCLQSSYNKTDFYFVFHFVCLWII